VRQFLKKIIKIKWAFYSIFYLYKGHRNSLEEQIYYSSEMTMCNTTWFFSDIWSMMHWSGYHCVPDTSNNLIVIRTTQVW